MSENNTTSNSATATTSSTEHTENHHQKGWAPIKKEFIVEKKKIEESIAKQSEAVEEQNLKKREREEDAENNAEEPSKKKKRGQNHSRYKSMSYAAEKQNKPVVDPTDEKNKIPYEVVRQLQKKKYNWKKAEEAVNKVNAMSSQKKQSSEKITVFDLNKIIMRAQQSKEAPKETTEATTSAPAATTSEPTAPATTTSKLSEEAKAYNETKLRPVEIKKVDFHDKLVLAPLTTVGNLPFRRICVNFGVDITVGEMAVGHNILKGNKQELSLLRRHESEKVFGIQIAGNNQEVMSRVAQFTAENLEVDFVDINCECPIGCICDRGMGAELMGRRNKLEGVVRSMKQILEVPLSVKMRTAIHDGKDLAHNLFPLLESWGADCLVLHGRSKEQRYTKEPRWDYIEQCAKTVKIPTIGCGDVLTYYDYLEHKEQQPSVASQMIGRGALIKPWIFKEIKEQKLYDITATERLDILKDFCKFGLDHYGGDEYGVQTTRRFLLEWISFLHRYIPVGLLDRMPPRQKINERPPLFVGRNELETLMASPNVQDWIKISEMMLGPTPAGFTFIPKHKSNSYAVTADQMQASKAHDDYA